MQHLEVRPLQVNQGIEFVENSIRDKVNTWQGSVDHAVVSNTNGVGLCELRQMLGEMICLANSIRKSTGEPLVGACSECIERRSACSGIAATG